MPPLRTLRDDLGDERLRTAILVGLATVPFTVALSWESVSDDGIVLGGTVSGGALLLAGILVGYYYNGRPTETRRAGIWTGLAGSLGTILVFGANSVTTITSASWPWTAVAAVLTPLTFGVGVVLTVVATTISAAGTDWLLTRLERDRRVVESESRDIAARDSKWRFAIGAYAILAPVTLFVALWPDGVGVALSVLLLLPTVLLSVVTLVALFVDVTAPRAATDWIPPVWLYVGGPIGVGVLVYLIAAVQEWGYPPGYGWYAFLGALWLAAAVYLVNSRRHRTNGRRSVSTS